MWQWHGKEKRTRGSRSARQQAIAVFSHVISRKVILKLYWILPLINRDSKNRKRRHILFYMTDKIFICIFILIFIFYYFYFIIFILLFLFF